ncbi:hypothetical protein ACS0TY_028299 [Phlomoides rotata]
MASGTELLHLNHANSDLCRRDSLIDSNSRQSWPCSRCSPGPESRCPTYDDLRRISMLDPYTCSRFSSVMSNYSIFEPNLHIDFVNALHLHVTPLKRPKMDASTRAMVEAIHANPTQAVLYPSGGASQAFGWLLSVPGASNTVLEAIVPYSRMSVIQLLGKVLILCPFTYFSVSLN